MRVRKQRPALTNISAAVELLEHRQLLSAGSQATSSVNAVVLGGSLFVTSNYVGANIIVNQDHIGEITLTGDGTTINGMTDPVTLSGVTSSVYFNFGAGDDTITFDETNSISISGSLTINGGAGSNRIEVVNDFSGSLNVGGNLSIVNQAGTLQKIRLGTLNIGGNVDIKNLGGIAWVDIGGDNPANSHIARNLNVFNGPGALAHTKLFQIDVHGSVFVQNSADFGDTYIGDATTRGDVVILNGVAKSGVSAKIQATDIGHDLLIIGSYSQRNFLDFFGTTVKGMTSVSGGNGGDEIDINQASFTGGFSAHFGNGRNLFSAASSHVAERTVYEIITEQITVNGRPTIQVRAVPVQEAFFLRGAPVTFNGPVNVALGSGNDMLSLGVNAQVKFGMRAIFNGQIGQNTATVGAANIIGYPVLIDFQVN